MMFACTVLNYMDRQAMSVVGPQVKAEFRLDDLWWGWVGAAFQLTYAFCQWPAGYLADRLDVRRTYALAVAWWSLAGIATSFSPALGVLLIFRAMLGVGESFNWPCALRITSRVLPPSDRSLGNGIFNSGAAVGAVLTPLIVVPLAARMGWRVPFRLLGVAGLVWVALWLLTTRHRLAGDRRSPDVSPSLAAGPSRPATASIGLALVVLAGLAVAASGFWVGLRAVWWGVAVMMIGPLVLVRGLSPEVLQQSRWARSLAEIAVLRRFWVMVAVGCTINVSWHFLVWWMANFFQEKRGLGLLIGGMVTSIPFLAADVGNLAGGAMVRSLVHRGWSIIRARKVVLCGCMVLISSAVVVGILVARGRPVAPEAHPMSTADWLQAFLQALRIDGSIVLLLSLTALGTAAFMVNYFAFGQDVAPQHTGLVIGYLGGLGNLFAAGFMPLAGWISQRHGFAPNFVIVGLLPLVGLAALLLFWGEDSPEAAPAEGLS